MHDCGGGTRSTRNDILARVKDRHESFLVERNGKPLARIMPIESAGRQATVAEALGAWCETRDPSFADDLERIGAADRPAGNPWAS